MKFLVRVPAEVTATATAYCSDPDGHGRNCPPNEIRWNPLATLDGRRFDLYDRPYTYATEAAAIRAGKREMMRRLKTWAADHLER